MSDIDDPLAWVTRAEADFATARTALRRKADFAFIACFHAQQCVEKYLKAMLISNEIAFAKTHDLAALGELCEQAGILVPVDIRLLDDLTDYAVRTRYPGDDPTPDEARVAYDTAKQVRKFARKFLGLKP
jgi:HEPN domain-containing protein